MPCPECGGSITLNEQDNPTYTWNCACGYVLDTCVVTGYNLRTFSGKIGFRLNDVAWAGRRDLLEGLDAVVPIRIYMHQHLNAFVQVRWPGWCLDCYALCIKPYLNSIDAVEYVTKTAVDRRDAWRTRGGGLMYGDFYRHLSNVDDPITRAYIRKNCCRGSGE